ncbi:hypothetical protein [Bosea sp. BK604]|uniref:hypothetical protein n=1 Tax=Bosea sp. BK604 TaxID=2512180 RepID=UPI0010433F33|nr:hypothetical protein [Bosea sp. BK604]TCR64647.1 hypothetical protein EV560_106112 [Bosea sp. BK604]
MDEARISLDTLAGGWIVDVIGENCGSQIGRISLADLLGQISGIEWAHDQDEEAALRAALVQMLRSNADRIELAANNLP